MVKLTKELKIKLLEAIRKGVFDGEEFPELQQELQKITIEVIDRAEQVDRKLLNNNH